MLERERLIEIPALNLAVLPCRQFIRDFSLEARRSKTRVVNQNMRIEVDKAGHVLYWIFREKVPQGVDKELIVDGISTATGKGVIYAVNNRIPVLKRRVEKLKNEKDRYFQRLDQANVKITITNPREKLIEKVIPVLGSDHIKGASIDDDPFYFGGVNFNIEDIEALDFMVKFTGEVAQKLSEQFDRIHQFPPKEDFTMQLDEYSWLLYDAGIPNQSLILDTVLGLLKDTSFIKNTSVLLPDGKFADSLEKAERDGKEVEVLTSIFGFPGFLPYTTTQLYWLANLKSQLENRIHRRNFPVIILPVKVHSKFLLVEGAALFGSHNLSSAGVKAGTREWSILTRNPKLLRNLNQQYNEFKQNI